MFKETTFPFKSVTPAHVELEHWVNSIASHCNAANIHWCEGTKEEYNRMCELLV